VRIVFVLPLISLCIGFGQTSGSSTLTQDRARNFLAASLKDKNPDSRKQAVQALGLVSPREPYLSQLEAMLDDKDVEVRLATITSLWICRIRAPSPRCRRRWIVMSPR
jgi:hypothetical protein